MDKGKLYLDLASSLGLEKTKVILNQCEKEGESFDKIYINKNIFPSGISNYPETLQKPYPKIDKTY